MPEDKQSPGFHHEEEQLSDVSPDEKKLRAETEMIQPRWSGHLNGILPIQDPQP